MKYYLIVFLIVFSTLTFSQKVSNYEVATGIFRNKVDNKKSLVIRRFIKSMSTYYLCVNPETLDTYLLKDSVGSFHPLTWDHIKENYKNTAYIKAINSALANSLQMQDAGISHGPPKEKGINLTIDLCPSSKPLDKIIVTSIVEEFNKIEKPVPMAFSVSGLWMKSHIQDLDWLKQQEAEGKITIDWINHSYNHYYNKNKPLQVNFLLKKGTNMSFEVLQNEITMIENGLIPSIMFRFPGLVSEQSIFDKVTDFGLIPIGSDAWLAKKQTPNSGSFVLIHGNGNEPLGVTDFLKLIKMEGANIKNKNWLLFDLHESLAEEEKKD